MTFRVRIFLLVLVVAVTAIGATAWLTISLTTREAARVDRARDRHEAAIVDEIRRFGIQRGQWAGIDGVVADLAESTGLHIRVETTSDTVLTDSDNLLGRAAGPIQLLSRQVQPVPALDPLIVSAADQMAMAAVLSGAAPDPVIRKIRPAATPAAPVLAADLFAPIPPGEPDAQALYQLAQYRAALVKVRCMAEHDAWSPALATITSPYLDPEQLSAEPSCRAAANNRVRGDTAWRDSLWTELSSCRLMMFAYDECLTERFAQGALSTSAVPVEIFFGAPGDPDLSQLSRQAGYGVAGVVVVAALGTAWIARRVSRPVHLLTGASLQLAAGRLDVRVPQGGGDDLDRLSASFNSMAEALQRSEERQRRLIADVAHELRTPLSNLRGYLEGLADGVIEPSPEIFASLHEETLLQRRILDDLQVLALAEAGDLDYTPVPVDLSELAATAATVHRAVADNAGVELVVDAPDPVEVRADPDRTRQVLGNLLSNAIRYTDAGGRVEISVARDAHGAFLWVRDTGVGMTPEEVTRVFDRFWRADPARQRATGGSGLGLTIARRIVADQGGTLVAESTPDLGTTFTVRLPAP
ncbi:two-component system sensor histidine kinase BaeS [Actinoplanes lutulentus]|uniref:histidine kinase n=1 Tax=Actinoplanes lutulentus TaxID=1287878 RepID=A0A327Z2L6_9ACTN|nr:ATP-binding protein [Actinoplanes lutulentus]MBB2943797.1 two-component system sensor histidine kinase BaeS [Actinoplanes lutulentus]RAK29339.1 two-component system sensor histidine kinase BaeS [Actinoplanes lutulentus]